MRRQLDLEIKQFTAMYGQLRLAYSRFQMCKNSVSQLTPENTKKISQIPLTASLYVPGHISDAEKVIVDIGTGYYVEKVRTNTYSLLKMRSASIRTSWLILMRTWRSCNRQLRESRIICAWLAK